MDYEWHDAIPSQHSLLTYSVLKADTYVRVPTVTYVCIYIYI